MFYKTKSIIPGASLVAAALLITSCGDSGEVDAGVSVIEAGATAIEAGAAAVDAGAAAVDAGTTAVDAGNTAIEAGNVAVDAGNTAVDVGNTAVDTVTGNGTDTTTAEVLTPVDVSAASLVTGAAKASGGEMAEDGSDFDFPEIVAQNGSMSMTIPDGPLPDQSARRSLSAGGGPSIEFGDAVVLKYDMFSWSTGELVESSSQLEGPYAVKAGISDNIPEYLAKSLLGRTLGETVQIVFPTGMEDLPSYLDPADAYVLVIELM